MTSRPLLLCCFSLSPHHALILPLTKQNNHPLSAACALIQSKHKKRGEKQCLFLHALQSMTRKRAIQLQLVEWYYKDYFGIQLGYKIPVPG